MRLDDDLDIDTDDLNEMEWLKAYEENDFDPYDDEDDDLNFDDLFDLDAALERVS